MHQKSIKNAVRHTPGGLLEAGDVWEAESAIPGTKFSGFLEEKLDFGRHFGSPVDFEGGPKISFLVIKLEKNEKMRSGTRAGFL